MYTQEEIGRMKLWQHSMENVVSFLKLEEMYNSRNIDIEKCNKTLISALEISAIVSWGQVFTIGEEDEGVCVRNSSYNYNEFLNTILLGCFDEEKEEFDNFNLIILKIRNKHIAHIDAKKAEIIHGSKSITYTPPESCFDYFYIDKEEFTPFVGYDFDENINLEGFIKFICDNSDNIHCNIKSRMISYAKKIVYYIDEIIKEYLRSQIDS